MAVSARAGSAAAASVALASRETRRIGIVDMASDRNQKGRRRARRHPPAGALHRACADCPGLALYLERSNVHLLIRISIDTKPRTDSWCLPAPAPRERRGNAVAAVAASGRHGQAQRVLRQPRGNARRRAEVLWRRAVEVGDRLGIAAPRQQGIGRRACAPHRAKPSRKARTASGSKCVPLPPAMIEQASSSVMRGR